MSLAKHASLLLLPIGISALGTAWYLEKLTPKTQAATPVAVAVAEVVQPFEVLDYPDVSQLAQLPREWPSAELSGDMGSYMPSEEYVSSNQGTASPVAQNQASDDDLDFTLDDIDLSSLSPDLAMKVENALSKSGSATSQRSTPVNDLEGNAQQWQGRLPALNLQTHMYASDSQRRWVKINNVEYHQGDVVDGQVTLKEIQPQAVIVEFEGEQIRIPALYEWEG
ncbi:general secretion pathway protein GspB [Vibrio natriegens]|uniref:General secretion pathway protein GspB n=1 Tax=Vibrio natriegens NBRC 15636 = ATCC 14048 = DSM 759 TaxID=1219067 RepID=A0AAN0Y035_VIBNA|nr:general secretion pathway protein GspB [Vibrio natriegens]ALR16541.1 general secretion pathway protein GspB [Vibrio natriegens NBRC 15636 = ATCC 14048 = DSM 759]ANQ11593.1 general secretion pathway protein GspB [Vibrio natriegens NBRC 15636 = ATCC 14048 = DSM 759]EPM39150.1 general secretion pathway protein B [Vibrio natriegens NBRC 15636 = ATCC 14048 = DSM 759]MDX6025931.1 general secretion pathway protein GspB [Vibrio natriegens NBRC 15636 = ATCC 14048 = DSM 759]UUI12044.1 general secreti